MTEKKANLVKGVVLGLSTVACAVATYYGAPAPVVGAITAVSNVIVGFIVKSVK